MRLVLIGLVVWLVFVILTMFPVKAEAHCFSRWFYPYPQRRSAPIASHGNHAAFARLTKERAVVQRHPSNPSEYIALPNPRRGMVEPP